ncbi:VWA domain-containing protein [Patescibacteria group bacterium]|nr:VWA domain-containing protein [Patescibacteria group bacterium]
MKPLSWSEKKKIQYSLGFFVVFWLLAGYPVYFAINSIYYNPPSCFDEIQNQDERDVDCGGICARVCTGDTQDLVVEWNKIFFVSTDRYDLAAKINNQNDDADIERFGYIFRVYDDKDNLLLTKEGIDYAKAGESFIVFESNIRLNDKKPYRSDIVFESNKKPHRSKFEIQTPLNWVASKVASNFIKTRKKTLIDNNTHTQLNVLLENTSFSTFSDTDVLTAISDIKNNPIGVSKTYIKSFPPNTEQNITFTWPVSLVEQTKNICSSLEDLPPELLYPADIMLVLDRSGSMNDDSAKPPQPITDAKEAAKIFIRKTQTVDRVGVVSFATNVSTSSTQTLTKDQSKAMSAINDITIGTPDNEQHTNIGDGIKKAFDEIQANSREKAKKAVILLTDGIASRPLNQGVTGGNYPEQYALLQAQKVKDEKISLYIIGLGSGINESFLKKLATTESHYYKAVNSSQLAKIYSDIAQAVCEEDMFTIEIFVRTPFQN